ncbi:MAG: hypothetical protein GY694_22025 [Gammaproteobacteria bacterium]|nr:hypothetical protein [Gammaproteobacteria bacterium]
MKQERAALYAKFEALTEEERELMKEFERSLTLPIMRKNFHETGLKSPMVSGTFKKFLSEKMG